MAQSGTWNITPDHGNRNTIEVTASGFDFPGKDAIRYRILDGRGSGIATLVTVLQTDTNSMTRVTGTLTIVLDSNIASLPDFSSLWTTILERGYFHQLDIRNNSGEDFHKVFGGTIDFKAVGADGTTSASASFTYSDGATSTAITVALGDSKKHNFAATAAPTVNDDTDVGYSVGSWWFDVTNDLAYVCLDNTDGAAVWQELVGRTVTQTLTNKTLTGHKWVKGADIASAAPLVLGTDGNYFDVTGTTGFAAITVAAGTFFMLQFAGALTLTHHATNLDLPSEANITTAAGDVLIGFATGTDTVQVVQYTKADGTAVVGSAATAIGGRKTITTSGNSSGSAIYRITGASVTLTFTSADILDTTFVCAVKNESATTATLATEGAETIEALTSLSFGPDASIWLYSDGTNLRTL